MKDTPNNRAAKRDVRFFDRHPSRRLRMRLPFPSEFAEELPPIPPGSRHFVIALRLPGAVGVLTAITGGPASVASDIDDYSDDEIKMALKTVAKFYPGPRKILEVLGAA